MILEAEFSEQAEVLHADFGGVPEISYPVVASISIEKMYAISASDTDAPSDWETDASTPTEDKPYLWMKTIIRGRTEDGTHFEYQDNGVVVGVCGKDGVSATHSWDGTTLTITTASGTSSADLKGEPGKDGYTPQKGIDYFDGNDGADGYTPVKGKDYFDGQPGKDGTSVTVSSVSESTTDGGSNVVTFSDGKTLTVKNGKTGATPTKGTDYFTDADIAEIVNAVYAKVADGNGVAY